MCCCSMWAEISTREKNGGYIARTPRLERFGTISDFIGEITEGKFDVRKKGYYSHTVSYYKERGFQKGAETWATFFGMKITRDVEGLKMMKALLPKTYEVYNKYYSQIPKVLSQKRRA